MDNSRIIKIWTRGFYDRSNGAMLLRMLENRQN